MLSQRAQYSSPTASLAGGRGPLVTATGRPARRRLLKLTGKKKTDARVVASRICSQCLLAWLLLACQLASPVALVTGKAVPWKHSECPGLAALSASWPGQIRTVFLDPTVEFAAQLLWIFGVVLGNVLMFFWAVDQIASGS